MSRGSSSKRRDSNRASLALRLERAAAPFAGAVVLALLTAHAGAGGVAPGDRAAFTATAYCDRGTTKAGVKAQRGVAAADPAVLPVGSVVQVDPWSSAHKGIYTVMDTGARVVGRRIDLYMSDCRQAERFGLQRVLVRVLRLGWNPEASAPEPGRIALATLARTRAAAAPSRVPSTSMPDDVSDGAITAKVKSRLALDETIRSRDIHVSTKDAVVTLTGQVASDAERAKAVQIARETDGVKSAVDHLQVKK